MKVNKNKYFPWILSIVLVLALGLAAGSVSLDYLTQEPITKSRMRMLPVPVDFRNYFMLQSIDNITNVIIGDFISARRIICVVQDDGKDQVSRFIEYNLETERFATPRNASTEFYTEYKKMKREIIEGVMFKNSYSYSMFSLDTLKELLKIPENIIKHEHGVMVKLYDPEKPSAIMAEFFFGKKHGKYDLVFQTNYYKYFNTKITPQLPYSVYCRKSSDPMVAETVEALLKIVGEVQR